METGPAWEKAGIILATRRTVAAMKILLYTMRRAGLNPETLRYDICVVFVRTSHNNDFSLMYDIDGITIVNG